MKTPLDGLWCLVIELTSELESDESDSRPKKCARIVDESKSTPMFRPMLQSMCRRDVGKGLTAISTIEDDVPLHEEDV